MTRPPRRTAQVDQRSEWSHITDDQLRAAAAASVGDIQQVPPMYSALKKKGVPLYELARKGIEVRLPSPHPASAAGGARTGSAPSRPRRPASLPPSACLLSPRGLPQREHCRYLGGPGPTHSAIFSSFPPQVERESRALTIYRFDVARTDSSSPLVDFRVARTSRRRRRPLCSPPAPVRQPLAPAVPASPTAPRRTPCRPQECSKGTYVRSLAHDLGAALGTHAHLTALRRDEIGDFRLEDAWSLDDIVAGVQAGRPAEAPKKPAPPRPPLQPAAGGTNRVIVTKHSAENRTS